VSTADSGDVLSVALRREGHTRKFQRGHALFTEDG